jgi:hypothetical protein
MRDFRILIDNTCAQDKLSYSKYDEVASSLAVIDTHPNRYDTAFLCSIKYACQQSRQLSRSGEVTRYAYELGKNFFKNENVKLYLNCYSFELFLRWRYI